MNNKTKQYLSKIKLTATLSKNNITSIYLAFFFGVHMRAVAQAKSIAIEKSNIKSCNIPHKLDRVF